MFYGNEETGGRYLYIFSRNLIEKMYISLHGNYPKQQNVSLVKTISTKYTSLILLRNSHCCCCCKVASVVSDSVRPHRRLYEKLKQKKKSGFVRFCVLCRGWGTRKRYFIFRNTYGLKRDLLPTLLKRNQIVLFDSIYLACPPF